MSQSELDLLLVTDEIETEQPDRYAQYKQYTTSAFLDALLSNDEKASLERKHDLQDFFQPYPFHKYGLRVRPEDQLFYYVPPHRPSLALACLATVVRDAGHSVRIIDNIFTYSWRLAQLDRLVAKTPPRLIGISTTFIMDPLTVEKMVARLRSASPTSKIVVGGPTARRVERLHGCADFAVFGSGEEPLLAILESLDGKRSPDSIPRTAYRDADGQLQYGKSGAEASLVGVAGKPYRAVPGEAIPVPDWSLYPRSSDQVFAIEFSRGCKYNCFYCAYDRGKNIRDLEDVRRELVANAERGVRKYRFGDSNFTDGPPSFPRYPHAVCELMIELDLDLEWSCYARVDDLSPELARLMKKAGCFAVFFGIESGDDRILKLMRKGHNVEDAYNGVQIARDAGIRAHANFIVGYPGETHESHLNTLDFIERARPDTVTLGQFSAEKETPVMGKKMKEFKLVGEGIDWEHTTLSAETARSWIPPAMQRLTANGIRIGNELEYALYMSLGLNFPEAAGLQDDLVLLQSTETAQEERDQALARVKQLVMERFPAVVERDQQLMRSLC